MMFMTERRPTKREEKMERLTVKVKAEVRNYEEERKKIKQF